MTDMNDKPIDQTFYIVTQAHYDELRCAQTMLVAMAQVSYNDEDLEKETLRPTHPRSDMNRFFAEVSAKIGSALDGIRKDNPNDPADRKSL